MEKQHIIEWLENLRLSENPDFEYNEEAIVQEYQIHQDNESSLAIKILSIFGGLMATLAFVGFLMMAGFNSEIGYVIFGVLFIFSAVNLNRYFHKLIIDTFSISLYIIGFILMGYGLLEMNFDDNFVITMVIALAAATLFFTQNYILSFIAILIISGGLFSYILANEILELIHVYIAFYTLLLTFVFLFEAKLISLHPTISKLYNPLRIGLIFSLLFGLIAVGKKFLLPIAPNQLWISSIPIILALYYVIYKILEINKIQSLPTKIYVYVLSSGILLSTLFAPSISGALLIISLSFMVNYKTGFVIGVIAFIYFISQYYYDLSFTLLTKSILMMSSGVLFLLLYFFTTKNLNSDEKV